MLKYHTDDIRTIAVVGHRAGGKTSLIDALLHKSHAVERLGNVDDGTSVSDFDEEEHKHHFSIDTTVTHVEHGGKFLHLLDAPGYPDFVGAALEALNAVETAVVVISAVNGIEVNTRKMFCEAGKHELARIIVINKIDAEHVNFPELVKQIQESFGKQCVLVNAPLGNGPGLRGLVSVLSPPEKTPADCPIDLAAHRSMLIDAIVECDDELMLKYLDEGNLSAQELEAGLPKAMECGTVVPIFCCDSKKEIGIDELLDAMSRFTPAPSHAHVRLEHSLRHDKPIDTSENAEFFGQVFKTVNDKFVGNLAFIRVLAGKMDTEHPLMNLRTSKSARVSNLLMMQGKTHQNVAEAYPGDIVAVAKVDGLHIGDTVAYKNTCPKLPEPEFPKPMFGLAIEPKNRGDEQKISQSLTKYSEEDPTFKVTHDHQTHEMVINGVSQLHLDVIQHRLKKRYDLEVLTHEPKIPYREAILGEGAADYRHKKQSGGRGQFGEVHLRVYSLNRDIHSQEQLEKEFANKSRFEKMRSVHYDPEFNFAFIDHIVGGTIPNQYMPAIEKGCKELLAGGALAGYRIQDVAVEVHFGKDHPVDSSEAAFKIAGKQAFKKAFLAAKPVLLEPVVKLEVTVPSKYVGSILSDLNTKRAHVENQDSLPGELTLISAQAPLSEVTRYAAQLGSITQGQGSYSMEFSHYDQVPANVQQQIVSKAKLKHDEDE